MLRLIGKWLKAGVLEEGRLLTVERGTPQGAVISLLLANIYLHYVYDLWVQRWRRRSAQGHVMVAVRRRHGGGLPIAVPTATSLFQQLRTTQSAVDVAWRSWACCGGLRRCNGRCAGAPPVLPLRHHGLRWCATRPRSWRIGFPAFTVRATQPPATQGKLETALGVLKCAPRLGPRPPLKKATAMLPDGSRRAQAAGATTQVTSYSSMMQGPRGACRDRRRSTSRVQPAGLRPEIGAPGRHRLGGGKGAEIERARFRAARGCPERSARSRSARPALPARPDGRRCARAPGQTPPRARRAADPAGRRPPAPVRSKLWPW